MNPLITKTAAKEAYLLNDKDIAPLQCQLKRSPEYRKTMMKLYNPAEVQEIAYKKWGSQDKIDAERERRLQRREALANRKAAPKLTRRQQLCDELAKYNLVIRNDSKMCAGYIENGEFGLDLVVETCRKMNWLYNETDYADELHEWIQGEYEYKGYCDTRDAADLIQDSVIKKHGGGKPWET